MKGYARRGVMLEEHKRTSDAEQERNDDAEVADGDGGRCALNEMRRINIEPDAEHEEDDADLAQQPEDVERRLREEERVGARPEMADD